MPHLIFNKEPELQTAIDEGLSEAFLSGKIGEESGIGPVAAEWGGAMTNLSQGLLQFPRDAERLRRALVSLPGALGKLLRDTVHHSRGSVLLSQSPGQLSRALVLVSQTLGMFPQRLGMLAQGLGK